MKSASVPVHSFHIPVMGTGFTIDSPLKVARYGISSVVSLVDDCLIERMRKHYASEYGEAYAPIADKDPDHRSRRITAYLDLMQKTIDHQMVEMKSQQFESDTDLTRYFEFLDDKSPLKAEYRQMLSMPKGPARVQMESKLKQSVACGSVDVNIMTKLDRSRPPKSGEAPELTDAKAALKGFAESCARGSVVFSAGINLTLYEFVSSFKAFAASSIATTTKKVTLKVSDFKSALVQGKVLAKKGVWVSEYRVESGLNCGGHAFATQGKLLGPVLEEFRKRKDELVQTLFELLKKSMTDDGYVPLAEPPPFVLTAQGGVGTGLEQEFLKDYYDLASVGWGTPFLLVPEATSVDPETLCELANATEEDVILSEASPLGVPFYILKNSASEKLRRARLAAGDPGSPCAHGFIAVNTEFSDNPACVASRFYQKRKLEELKSQGLSPERLEAAMRKVTAKSCICHDLGQGAVRAHELESDKRDSGAPAICPGPNIAFFSRIASLKEMIDHIYGRANLLDTDKLRPHVFVNELKLYVDYLNQQFKAALDAFSDKQIAYWKEFIENLTEGIRYYRDIASQLRVQTEESRQRFLRDLDEFQDRILKLVQSQPQLVL